MAADREGGECGRTRPSFTWETAGNQPCLGLRPGAHWQPEPLFQGEQPLLYPAFWFSSARSLSLDNSSGHLHHQQTFADAGCNARNP